MSDSPATDSVSLTRLELPPGRRPRPKPRALHQLVWVQNGAVRLRLEGGQRELAEGALIFVAPGQAVALHARGPEAIVVVMGVAAALLEPLPRAHPALEGRFFWARTPQVAHRDPAALARLNQAALRLERGRRDPLAVMAFLLPLLSELSEEIVDEGLPDWLAGAMVAAREPRVFREGAAGLVRAAGRAHPHVSRMMRRYTGKTPSDYVNGLRMAHAAWRLTGSDDPLGEIAAEVGLPNLSHFHKLFRAHHGQTPAAYRRARCGKYLTVW